MRPIGPAAYQYRPIKVEAMRYTRVNGDHVREWVSGTRGNLNGDEYILVYTTSGIVAARPGECIVRDQRLGWLVMSEDEFAERFERVIS